jgi:protein required for attachment to host cells
MKGRSWVIVANKEKAKIYRVVKVGQFEEVASFVHPDGIKKGTDYYSERPSRAFDRMGVGRHAMEPETSLDEKRCATFAHILGDFLQASALRGDFDSLYVASEAKFLGYIRKLWPKQLVEKIDESFVKDIVSESPQSVWEHLQLTV